MVNDIIHRDADKVIRLTNRVISFPTADKLRSISAGRLAESAAFTRVVGSIDGCGIRIKPPSEDSHCCFSRKLFNASQMQAMRDHQCRFLDIFVGYQGSAHFKIAPWMFTFGIMKSRWRSFFFFQDSGSVFTFQV